MSQTALTSRWGQDLGTDHPCLPCCPHVVVSIGRKDEQTRKELKNQRTTAKDVLWSTPADSPEITSSTDTGHSWSSSPACGTLKFISCRPHVIPGVSNSGIQKPCNWVCFQLCWQSLLVRGSSRSLTLWNGSAYHLKKNTLGTNKQKALIELFNVTIMIDNPVFDHRLEVQVRIYECTSQTSIKWFIGFARKIHFWICHSAFRYC